MSILKLNSANPGVKRPLKVQDLADLWCGLNTALAQGTETSPRILCGFNANGDDDSFTSGVIAYNGRLYLYDDSDPIFLEDSIYGVEIPTDDNRVMGDGTTQLFSYACIATKDSTLPGAVFIGEASPSNIRAWRGPLSIPDLSISRNMIADTAISTPKLANSAVTTEKIADGSVTTEKIADGSVTPVKCSAAPFVRSGVTKYTGNCYINVTGLFIVTLQSTQTTITFGPRLLGVIHIIARNTTSQAITVQLNGPTGISDFGSFSVSSNSQYAITVRITTGSPNTVIEARKLDFFRTFPLLD